MKKLLTLSIFSMLISALFSQGLDISEAARTMQNGTYNSYLFELPDVGKNQAEEDWKKFMSQFKAKTKFNKKSGLWFSDNAKMPRLSDNTVDVYARIIEDSNPKKQTSVVVWFDLGGAYVNTATHRTEASYSHAILEEYAMQTSKHHAEAITKAEEEKLKDLEKEMKKLLKDNDNYHEQIDEAKALIETMEKNIEKNEEDKKAKASEIEAQKTAVAEAKANEGKF